MRPWIGAFACSFFCVLGISCGSNLENTDTVQGSGGSEGLVDDENSPLCAPFESDETGGEEPFPPDGVAAVLYVCEGTVEVDISGQICLLGSGSECDAGLPILPSDAILQDEVAVGVPSPDFASATNMYPEPTLGACCVDSAEDPQALDDALDTVCQADCGARACIAAAEELAAIVADEACHWGSLDLNACHLDLPEVCNGICVQSQILGKTINDINFILSELQKPDVFEQCANSIRSVQGWRPCLTADPDCYDPPSEVDSGRIVEMKFMADCGGVQPVLFDGDGSPDSPEVCEFNVNANIGAALPGEGFGGPLLGGELSLDTPLGVASTAVVGSSIAFRRMGCGPGTCPFTLTNLEVDFDDFVLGPVTITGLHAGLVEPVVGVLHGDQTATIDDRAMRVDVTFGVSVGGKNSFDGKPLPNGDFSLRVSNDNPISMLIEANNTVEILEASFGLPVDTSMRLTTTPTPCVPEG